MENSFTALLEMPPSLAVELLHSSTSHDTPPPITDQHVVVSGDVLKRHRISALNNNSSSSFLLPHFPSDAALIERAAKYSVFASGGEKVKVEPDEDSGGGGGGGGGEKNCCSEGEEKNNDDDNNGNVNSSLSSPLKRKERDRKGKGSSKKSKTAVAAAEGNQSTEEGEKLPYVHVRARRGQATDSHSLAERARREKINARMKLLQELVPGCNKISGTALVLDEIINHVQSLQRQVEYLSMRLAAVNPGPNFNLDSLFAAGTESMMNCNFANTGMPLMWSEAQMNGDRQPFPQQWHFESLNQPVWVKEENQHNIVTSENSLLSYDSSGNSASLHSNQLKMEL